MRFLMVMSVASLLWSCGSNVKQDEQEFQSQLQSDSVGHVNPGIDDAFVEGILQQIPSPIEVSTLLQQSGAPYESALLNDPDRAADYGTNFRKALNLGVFGTDLYYTNIYGKNTDGMKLLDPIKSLANDLDIGQFFDIKTLARLASNSDHLDSLLVMTTQNFNDINVYLQDRKRSELSVLMLTGGWVEAMHFLCQAYRYNPENKDLADHIGEQKIIMERLLLLYPYYSSDKHILDLAADMKKLESAYAGVEILKSYKESTVEIVNGVGIIKDNSTTTVKITPEQLAEITRLTSIVREKIVK